MLKHAEEHLGFSNADVYDTYKRHMMVFNRSPEHDVLNGVWRTSLCFAFGKLANVKLVGILFPICPTARLFYFFF